MDGTNPSLVEALGAGNAVLAHDNPYNRWVAGEAGVYFRDEVECARWLEALLGEGGQPSPPAHLPVGEGGATPTPALPPRGEGGCFVRPGNVAGTAAGSCAQAACGGVHLGTGTGRL